MHFRVFVPQDHPDRSHWLLTDPVLSTHVQRMTALSRGQPLALLGDTRFPKSKGHAVPSWGHPGVAELSLCTRARLDPGISPRSGQSSPEEQALGRSVTGAGGRYGIKGLCIPIRRSAGRLRPPSDSPKFGALTAIT